MKNLKKAKKIIRVNYCFENGDELEIPFIYKPAVMNHIKLQFDDYLFSPMREKENRPYFTALLDSAIIYVKYSGEVTRKLLLNKKELQKLNKSVKNTGLTIIPLKLYTNEKGIAKLEIALAKGKKLYDKRQTMIDRDNKRNLDRVKKENKS